MGELVRFMEVKHDAAYNIAFKNILKFVAVFWKLFWTTLLRTKKSEYDSKPFTYSKLAYIRCCNLWHDNSTFLGHLLLVSIVGMLSVAVSIEWQRECKDFPKKTTGMFQEAPFFHKDVKALRIFYLNLITYLVEEGYHRWTVLTLSSSVSLSLEMNTITEMNGL